MRLFQPEIAGVPGVKRSERGHARKAAVRPARKPKPGADFQVWFDYLLNESTRYFQKLNCERSVSRPGAGLRQMKRRQLWPDPWRAFGRLVQSTLAAEQWHWHEDGAGTQAHFILYPDQPSRRRQFEVTLRLAFSAQPKILSRFSLELIDQATIDPADYFERQRGVRMQISSSSSSYLAAPPPSGR